MILILMLRASRGGRVELADVLLDDQALRYPEDVLGFVGDYRETKGDGARAGCHDHIIQRFERVDEGRYTLEGILHQACRVARLDVAEDQRCTYRYGYCVDYAGHVLAQWDHTQRWLRVLYPTSVHWSMIPPTRVTRIPCAW